MKYRTRKQTKREKWKQERRLAKKKYEELAQIAERSGDISGAHTYFQIAENYLSEKDLEQF